MVTNQRYDVVITLQELHHPAYVALGIVARALLTELRSLEQPFQIPVVSISVRDAMGRLNVSERPVQRAFDALERLGWIEESKSGPGRRRVVLLKSPAVDSHG